MPRDLHENASSRSCPQPEHRKRAKPWARMPQLRSFSTHEDTVAPGVTLGSLCKERLEMVLDHRVEWCGGGTARTVDVLGARPPRCTLRCVSVSGSLLRRVRHGGGCAPAWGAAMVERARQSKRRNSTRSMLPLAAEFIGGRKPSRPLRAQAGGSGREVARAEVIGPDLLQLGDLLRAYGFRARTPASEYTPGGRVDRTGDISAQHGALPVTSWLCHRDSGQ